MNPDLDRRLADLADAATRATTGIDPVTTLAVFRRRRRTRAAAATVTAVAAVVGLALGVAQLAPDAPVDPADTVEWPTVDHSLPMGACGSAAESMPIMGSSVWPEMSPQAVSVKRGEMPDLTVTITNLGGDDYAPWPARTGPLILVRDGVVVGFTSPTSQDATTGPDGEEVPISNFGPAVLCEAGELVPDGSLDGRTALPEGTYRAWPVTALVAGSVDREWTFDLIGDEGSLTVTAAPVPKPTAIEPSDPALACGLTLEDGLLQVTGIDLAAPLPADGPTDEITARLLDGTMDPEGAIGVAIGVAFVPGPFVDTADLPDVTYTLRALVVDANGRVVGYSEAWQLHGGLMELEHALVPATCPGQDELASRTGDELELRISAVRSGPTVADSLAVSDALPFTVAEPEFIEVEGPGSCGEVFFLDGVSESTGVLAGLSTKISEVQLERDGTVTARILVRNSAETPHRGTLTLTHFLVEEFDGPYNGSPLTPPAPVVLAQDLTVPAGGSLDFDVEIAMEPCDTGVLPLDAAEYIVSTSLELDTATGMLSVSSPALSVTID